MLGCVLMVAETFSNRGWAVLNGLRFDGLCLMVALGWTMWLFLMGSV